MLMTKQTFRLCATSFRTTLHGRIITHRTFSNDSSSGVLRRYLFLTNVVAGGALMGLGDFLQQRITAHRHSHSQETPSHNWVRSRDMIVIGGVLGSAQHVFYKALDRLVPGVNFNSVAKKIVLDLSIASPVIIVVFIGGIGLLERRSAEELRKELKDKFLPIFIADCVIWPPIQYVNFAYLPNRYRVIYVNVLMVIYDIFLSYIKYDYNPGKESQ